MLTEVGFPIAINEHVDLSRKYTYSPYMIAGYIYLSGVYRKKIRRSEIFPIPSEKPRDGKLCRFQ